MSKKITINLTSEEYKLLMSILNEVEEDRINMLCNDPYDTEEKIFTKKERIEMGKRIHGKVYDDFNDGFLFNSDYVKYIIDRIKEEKNEN